MQGKANTIPALFAARVQQYGPRAALLAKRDGAYQPITWQEYGRQVHDLALGLISVGINPGDRVALLAANSPGWVTADLAILSVGAVNVPVHITLTPKQIEYIVNDAECRLLFVTGPELLARVTPIRQNLAQLQLVITARCPDAPTGPGFLTVEELSARGREEVGKGGESELERRLEGLRPDGLASIIYTSGTTGTPKGVMLTHHNFLSNVEACLQVLPITDRDTALNFLPLSHVFARTCDAYVIMGAGGTMAFAESPDKVAANMLEVRPTIMNAVPRFYEKLHLMVMDMAAHTRGLKRRIFNWALRMGAARAAMQNSGRQPSGWFGFKYRLADRLAYRRLRERLGGRLRFFVSGGAPLPRKVAEFFGGVGITICEGYGLTESSPIICVNPVDAVRFGTVGPPIPGVEVKIAEDGEILTRGPHVMQGYFHREQDTAETITDGWLHTGDIGVLDEKGYLAITDRKKDLIVTAGGKNVAPQAIENALVGPWVSQVIVHGDKRKFLSALVVPDFARLEAWAAEQGLKWETRAELVGLPGVHELYEKHINERLRDFAEFEQIRRFALMEREFTIGDGEVTPTLKLKRKVITERYQHVLDAFYTD